MTRFRTYAQLVRLPNVFTAFADIALGTTVGWTLFSDANTSVPWLTAAFLLAASGCLYCAGMVWNDVFDVEQDRRERPFRPLPSGKVSRRAAAVLGLALLVAGLGFAVLAGYRDEEFVSLPLVLAIVLVGAILLYDGWLKRTPAGPLGMGACRFLNVLLGLSVVAHPSWGFNLYLALIVGLYIVGVTWFARTEARLSSQVALSSAAGVMLASLILAALLPGLPASVLPTAHITAVAFPYLLVVFGCLIGFPLWRAIRKPVPSLVQAAVKRTVLGLVFLDAILATGLVGFAGLLILLFLLPALYLGRWLYST